MKLKRKLFMVLMLSMITFGTIAVFAAEKRQTKTYSVADTSTTLSAYAYIIDSGFGRHNGTSNGSLTGTDRAAAGNYKITSTFGTSSYYMYIGTSYDDYYEYKMKTGWFSKVTTSIKTTSGTSNLVSASVSD